MYMATVFLVLIIMGVVTWSLANLVVASNGKSANLYADTQAELAAVAGVEYAFYNLIKDFANWTGTTSPVTVGNSAFRVDVDTLDENGVKLTADERRIVSTGTIGSSVKKIQVHFKAADESFSFAMYVNELTDPSKSKSLKISMNNTLKGNLYFGISVDVNIQRADIDTTTIYVPPGHVVTSSPADFDDTYKSQIYPPPLPEFPVFDTTVHDSLLAIASAITTSSGNKINGDLTINSAWDLSTYTDNTVFINGNLTVTGASATIASLTTQNPGYIVVDGTVDYKNGCSVGDNIVTIASGNVAVISTGTRYGEDWSSLPVTQRPARVNELFSHANVDLTAGIVFANVESMGDLQLRGTIYAACYAVGIVEIESATFQGSVVANSVKLDRIANSIMEFILPLAISSTGGLKPTVVSGSWKML